MSLPTRCSLDPCDLHVQYAQLLPDGRGMPSTAIPDGHAGKTELYPENSCVGP